MVWAGGESINASLLINLNMRIVNLQVAVELGQRGDYKGFDYYKKSFMDLVKNDILEAFDDFIKPCQEAIWEVILKDQQNIKNWKSQEYCHFGISAALSNLNVMINRLLDWKLK